MAPRRRRTGASVVRIGSGLAALAIGLVVLAPVVLSGPATALAPLSAPGRTVRDHASAAPNPGPGPAYWLAGADGGLFAFGRGAFVGALGPRRPAGIIRAVAATPSGNGYWLAGADGGVFAFGDAPFLGAAHGARSPVVAMAATATGHGYWLASADGGVFAFGDAGFHGSAASLHPRAAIVGMAATPTGLGYWLAGADGGVYAFGDAPFLGNASSLRLAAPVTSMAATPSGHGYWLAGADGGVYAFGDAPFAGNVASALHRGSVVGMASTHTGRGYWLAGSDGGVFSFGDAGYYGSTGGLRLQGPVTAIVSGQGTAIPRAPSSPVSNLGYDVSWPQCGSLLPAQPYGFAVVGITNGQMFSTNPCFASEWQWASSGGSFAGVYMNTDAFTATQWQIFLTQGGARCHGDIGCALYQWGSQGAQVALAAARRVPAPLWWLDVETANTWLPDPAANAVILRGVIDTLRSAGKQVGIYSTSLQWGMVAGAFSPALPTWVAGAPNDDLAGWCSGHSFGGGTTVLVQALYGSVDIDYLCATAKTAAASRQVFAPPAPLPIPTFAPTAAPASGPHAATSPAPPVPTSVGRVFAAPAPMPADAAPVRAAPAPAARTSSHHHIAWWLVAFAWAVLIATGAAGWRIGAPRGGFDALHRSLHDAH